MAIGPLEITAQQIVGLDVNFTRFINRLLEAEVAAENHPRHLLIVNDDETINDGGVDASVHQWATEDGFVPLGDTAFQFKRGEHGPAACARELRKATWAHEYLRQGGSYIVAIGTPLSESLMANRHVELMKVAVELGLLVDGQESRIRVYDANVLARWASGFASMAVSQMVNGPGRNVQDFDQWANGRTHVLEWVPDEKRTEIVETLRDAIRPSGVLDFRLQGESGVGKTRLALEALRDPELQPLVLYVRDVKDLSGEVIAHLTHGRAAILVVDECPPDDHVKVLERLRRDSPVRLITIGPNGSIASSGALFGLRPVESDTTEKFLEKNYPGMPSESMSFVVRHSRGNMRWTMILADKVETVSDAQAAELIAKNDIEQFVTSFLPQGKDFFFAAVLALFERVGWEGDLGYQLAIVADFAGTTVEEMKMTSTLLEQNGLIVRQGRYRSITPHPLSVFMAAEAWKDLGSRISTDLMPRLDDDLATSFFGRVADLGQFEPARKVLAELLDPNAPFGSLESLQRDSLGRLLTSIAIVMPELVTEHLSDLIERATTEDLRSLTKVRRTLVWALEKLVWHRKTFESAADSLLLLALNENESYSNNATGTWLDLFNAVLPGTAALPDERAAYLRARVGRSEETDRLIVRAASKGLDGHESITVSGELQSGSLVERRGGALTLGDVASYRAAMMDILLLLVRDSDASSTFAAEDALIAALHTLIDDPLSSAPLATALSQLGSGARTRLRIEAERLLLLYQRRNGDEQESKDDAERDAHMASLLRDFLSSLPPQTAEEQFRVLSEMTQWDFEGDSLVERITNVLQELGTENARRLLIESSDTAKLPAAWQIGEAGATVLGNDDALLQALASSPPKNLGVATGYLTCVARDSDTSVMETFLLSLNTWPLGDVLQLAIRTPESVAVSRLIESGLKALPVSEAVYLALPWSRGMSDEEVRALFLDFRSRVRSQADYNATLEYINISSHGRESLDEAMSDDKLELARMRLVYPELGQKSSSWSRNLETATAQHAKEVAELVVELVVDKKLTLSSRGTESRLIARCARDDPQQVWSVFAKALNGKKSWTLQFGLRDWFIPLFDSSVVTSWIGEDVERARLVATLTPADLPEPSAVVAYLLERFDDENIESRLYSSFVSGFWTGNESDRIRRQLLNLDGWSNPQQPSKVRRWAKQTTASLKKSLTRVLEEEAEERF